MPRIRTITPTLIVLLTLALVFVTSAARAEKRIALVVGNAAYQAGMLNTPANDAGLIAQTLQAAGFDVVGARDLDQDSVRRAFRDFLEKATSSGPDTVAFIYVSGYGVQLEGENYFVPIDARIARDADVTAEALRISDYTRPTRRAEAQGRHRRSGHCADQSIRQVWTAARRRARNSRAGAQPADGVQRSAGDGGAGGPRPLWTLRPGAGRDDPRRRPAARGGF
jgi:Caspase domain